MKMQEVITRLRELAPKAEMNVRAACEDFENLRDVLKDADHTNSPVSLRVLLAACSEKADMVSKALCEARESVDNLATVNREYKEKLGPRGPKKTKDAQGQQILTGLEQTVEETPATEAAKAESRIAGGRHG